MTRWVLGVNCRREVTHNSTEYLGLISLSIISFSLNKTYKLKQNSEISLRECPQIYEKLLYTVISLFVAAALIRICSPFFKENFKIGGATLIRVIRRT